MTTIIYGIAFTSIILSLSLVYGSYLLKDTSKLKQYFWGTVEDRK